MPKRIKDLIASLPPDRQKAIEAETQRLIVETSESIHTGSSFDDWLREEGIEAEVTIQALKNVNAYLLKMLTRLQTIERLAREYVAADKAMDSNTPGSLQEAEAAFTRLADFLGERIR